MNLNDIKLSNNKRDEDIISAFFHYLIFLCLKKSSSNISIQLQEGKIVEIKKDSENIPVDPKEVNKRMRLGRCKW